MRFILLLLLSTLLTACKQPEPLNAKQVLDSVYPQYDAKHACWVADDKVSNPYCMKLDSEKLLHLSSGDRLYVLVAGEMVDENGVWNGSHANAGLVGAFVAEKISGKTKIIAANANIPSGTFGQAPNGWKLVQLGANDYWGWLNSWGDCHQGDCGSFYSIFVPYGKSIKDTGLVTQSVDNTGACADDEDVCSKTTVKLESTLKIDTSNQDARVYPLQITVTGLNQGIKIKPTIWTLTFNTKKWAYQEPKDYPLSGREF